MICRVLDYKEGLHPSTCDSLHPQLVVLLMLGGKKSFVTSVKTHTYLPVNTNALTTKGRAPLPADDNSHAAVLPPTQL